MLLRRDTNFADAPETAQNGGFRREFAKPRDYAGFPLSCCGPRPKGLFAPNGWPQKRTLWRNGDENRHFGRFQARRRNLGRGARAFWVGQAEFVRRSRMEEAYVGMGLLRAPVMPKQTFLASETILGPCRCHVAETHVFDLSARRAP